MKIKLLNHVFEYANQVSEIAKLFETINQQMEDEQLQLSHLIVDKVPVYQDYYAFFEKNIATIQQVEVICKHMEALVDETLASAYDYLKNGKLTVQEMANTFYQQPKDQTWNTFSNLLEGIEWLINTQSRIDQIKGLKSIIKDYSVWNEYVQLIKKMIAVLPELEEAMAQQDHVLIGDLLLYEILPLFEAGELKLCFLIPGEEGNYVS
jgi:hypothetical protein